MVHVERKKTNTLSRLACQIKVGVDANVHHQIQHKIGWYEVAMCVLTNTVCVEMVLVLILWSHVTGDKDNKMSALLLLHTF